MFLVLFTLVAVAALTHLPLISGGLDALNSDYAPIWIFAEELKSGKLSAFVFNMHYAGVVLTVVRATWLGLFTVFLPETQAFWMGNLTFSFQVIPSLMAFAAFWCARGYASRAVAWIVALLVAVGFPAFDGHLHNDVYTANFIFAAWVLGLRARIKSLWSGELTSWQFFSCALLTGLMIYNSRICLIPAAVLWMPPLAVIREELERLRPTSLFARWAMGAVGLLLGLFLYPELFGADLGKFFGKTVKMHGMPNLKLAVLLAGLVWLMQGGFRKVWPLRNRIALALGGAMVGFLPEIVHRLRWIGSMPEGTEQSRSISEAISVLGHVPESFREIVAVAGSGWGVISVLLWGLPVVLIGIGYLRDRNRRLESAFVYLLLCLLAFCRVRNYAGITSRYLYPAVPALVVGSTLLVDRMFSRRGWVVLSLLAVSVHGADLVGSRMEFSRHALESHRWETGRAIVETFHAAGVPVVATDDYWRTNELSVASSLHPLFLVTTDVPGVIHPGALDLMKMSDPVGFLLRSELPPRSEYATSGAVWELSPLKSIEGRFLYLGRRKSPLPAHSGAGG